MARKRYRHRRKAPQAAPRVALVRPGRLAPKGKWSRPGLSATDRIVAQGKLAQFEMDLRRRLWPKRMRGYEADPLRWLGPRGWRRFR